MDMPAPGTNVFVSYSHADERLVGPVVKLLRANRALVFLDADSIRAGKRWRGEIAQGLSEAAMVLVFWCTHSSLSEEVAKEWKAAIDQDKDLLPLLLDATPLPPELASFQWIDFREVVGPGHGKVAFLPPERRPPPEPAKPRARPAAWYAGGGLAAALLAAVSIGLFTGHEPEDRATPPAGLPDLPLPVPPPPEAMQLPWLAMALGAAVLIALGVGLAWWLRRRRSRRYVYVEHLTRSRLVERHIATAIEEEILRRAGRAATTDGG
jgi:hypothetical protein